MFALVQNESFCAGAEDDAEMIYAFATRFADTYLSYL
jgi:hypothetical protein